MLIFQLAGGNEFGKNYKMCKKTCQGMFEMCVSAVCQRDPLALAAGRGRCREELQNCYQRCFREIIESLKHLTTLH
ncbi:hypothetical protein LSAT2_005663 [Lamellibrachia satsuma]|nr:hypothetical protein LSAT2_005663 [Lamellibrachia satsuma]